MTFYILRHQMVQYPTVNNNADLEFLYTPQCKVHKLAKNLRDISKNNEGLKKTKFIALAR